MATIKPSYNAYIQHDTWVQFIEPPQTWTTIHPCIHTYWQSRVATWPSLHVLGLWEETKSPGGNPDKQWETPHRMKARVSNPEPARCERHHGLMVPPKSAHSVCKSGHSQIFPPPLCLSVPAWLQMWYTPLLGWMTLVSDADRVSPVRTHAQWCTAAISWIPDSLRLGSWATHTHTERAAAGVNSCRLARVREFKSVHSNKRSEEKKKKKAVKRLGDIFQHYSNSSGVSVFDYGAVKPEALGAAL